jgi:hypothetical protein
MERPVRRASGFVGVGVLLAALVVADRASSRGARP